MRRTANGRQDREAKRARSRAGGIDLHALPFDRLAALSNVEGRHTFGTHLSKNGVAPRTARAALRHSSLDLTMNV